MLQKDRHDQYRFTEFAETSYWGRRRSTQRRLFSWRQHGHSVVHRHNISHCRKRESVDLWPRGQNSDVCLRTQWTLFSVVHSTREAGIKTQAQTPRPRGSAAPTDVVYTVVRSLLAGAVAHHHSCTPSLKLAAAPNPLPLSSSHAGPAAVCHPVSTVYVQRSLSVTCRGSAKVEGRGGAMPPHLRLPPSPHLGSMEK